jgi:hypothetical protein
MTTSFEWDLDKDAENQKKHGVSFSLAQEALLDSQRVIAQLAIWRIASPKNVSIVSDRWAEELLPCASPIGTT